MKLSEVAPELAKYFAARGTAMPDVLQKALLFGSYARGDARVGSDIDIALVAHAPWETAQRSQMRDWLEDFNSNLVVNPFFTTTDKLAENEDKFDANYWIAREGVLLWER